MHETSEMQSLQGNSGAALEESKQGGLLWDSRENSSPGGVEEKWR